MRMGAVWACGLMALGFVSVAEALTPAGVWTTVDDKTGKQRADVRLVITDGVLNGTIIGVHRQPGDIGICAACPGDFKDKPVIGLPFIWGLRETSDGTWAGGRILDAKTGKIYRVSMAVKDDKLYVRGYLGVSWLGRTQIWVHG